MLAFFQEKNNDSSASTELNYYLEILQSFSLVMTGLEIGN